MAGMKELREAAKAAGIPAREIRSAESSAELRKMIREASNGTATRSTRKRVVKKAVGKAVPKRRGRPPGSKNKTTRAKASAPAKRGRPKGSTTRKAKSSNGNGGRFLLGKINWSKVGNWNPREGTVPDQIVKALKKVKGDREKAYKALRPKLASLVPPKTRNGRKRNQAEREDYLRYLISRNAWAYAMATGQHQPSSNRQEYGTGGTGTGVFKRKGTRKAAPKRSTAKRGPGRPKGSKSTTKPAAKRRGRPPGSKNKPKTTARRKTTRR
jgi:hypothetical protein